MDYNYDIQSSQVVVLKNYITECKTKKINIINLATHKKTKIVSHKNFNANTRVHNSRCIILLTTLKNDFNNLYFLDINKRTLKKVAVDVSNHTLAQSKFIFSDNNNYILMSFSDKANYIINNKYQLFRELSVESNKWLYLLNDATILCIVENKGLKLYKYSITSQDIVITTISDSLDGEFEMFTDNSNNAIITYIKNNNTYISGIDINTMKINKSLVCNGIASDKYYTMKVKTGIKIYNIEGDIVNYLPIIHSDYDKGILIDDFVVYAGCGGKFIIYHVKYGYIGCITNANAFDYKTFGYYIFLIRLKNMQIYHLNLFLRKQNVKELLLSSKYGNNSSIYKFANNVLFDYHLFGEIFSFLPNIERN
jgi:hypothetical protein